MHISDLYTFYDNSNCLLYNVDEHLNNIMHVYIPYKNTSLIKGFNPNKL